jgi:hypothetical protein
MKLYYFNTESNEYVDRGIGNLQIKLKREVNKKELIIRSLSGNNYHHQFKFILKDLNFYRSYSITHIAYKTDTC